MKMVVRRLSLSAKVSLPASTPLGTISPHVGVEVEVEIPLDGVDELEEQLEDARGAIMAKLRALMVMSALDLEEVCKVHDSGGMEALVSEFLCGDSDDDDEDE